MTGMSPLRRRTAVGALMLVFLQFAMLAAAPVAACCAPGRQAASVEQEDCCPPGSHLPGQCPLHKTAPRSSDCRLTCARAGIDVFMPGTVGVLPSPAVTSAPAPASIPVHIASLLPPSADADPFTPPPR
jgi:hypothetical protein